MVYMCVMIILHMYINQDAKEKVKNFYACETNKLLNFSII